MTACTGRSAAGIVREMQTLAPPGQRLIDAPTLLELRRLTGSLLSARTSAAEYRRFRAVRHRSLGGAPGFRPTGGGTVLVTGGTGCIGSVLLTQLVQREHGRIVSVSRGVTEPRLRVPGVEYRRTDIRSRSAVAETFAEVGPDVVFHLAGVRDPGRAEREVRNTIETNVIGTGNVVEAAEDHGVERLVYASTGKAVRLFTGDVYAATKKVGEWQLSTADRPVTSAVRFTHVVDNSLILGKLRDWSAGGVVRLHDPGIAFYVQSALESAQLLMAAAGRSGLYTIRDLGWPVELLDLAIGMMQESGRISPIYFCGWERGYCAESQRALYDPRTNGETGPLVNALESYSAEPALDEQLNRVPIPAAGGGGCGAAVHQLVADCVAGAPEEVLRAGLTRASWALLETALNAAAPADLARLRRLVAAGAGAGAGAGSYSGEHRMIDAAIGAAGALARAG